MSSKKTERIAQQLTERMGSTSLFLVSQVSHLMARRANRELARSGFRLQLEQLPILFPVYFAGDDLFSQQEIANFLQKDKSGIQRSLRTLERDGYLRITASADDRRKNLVQLTAAGKLVVEKLLETVLTIDEQLTRQVPDAEVRSLLTTLQKFSALLKE
jgi:DNA-binding MarR family transcriptional regulator